MHLYASWLQELAIELRAKQDLLASGNHTVFSVMARFTPLRYWLVSASAIKIYQVSLLAGLGALGLYFIRIGRYQTHSTVAEVAFLIACIPLLAFTSENAFLFTLPVIVLLLGHLN
jgi:hypothetical protein